MLRLFLRIYHLLARIIETATIFAYEAHKSALL